MRKNLFCWTSSDFGAQKFLWFCQKRFELLLSTDLLGGRKNDETFSKKLFSVVCYQTDSFKFKTTYKRAQKLNAENGKLILPSKLQQNFINKFFESCVLDVQWSFLRKKILGVIQDSERNHFWWWFQTSYCTSLKAHLRRSFFGKTFPIEFLWFQEGSFWQVLSEVTWTSHVNRFFRKKVVCNFWEKTNSRGGVQICFCTCFGKNMFWKRFLEISCLLSCLEQWGKTIFADELKTNFYQPKISFADFFPN